MKYLKLIICLFFTQQIFGQNAVSLNIRLTNTPKGIFVEFGQKALIGRDFELWRKTSSETAFRKIATMKAPNSQGDVRRRIAESQAVFVEGSRPNITDLDNIWKKYKDKKDNLLSFISIIPQLEFAFNLAYLDTEIRPNEKYQYQLAENRVPIASSEPLIYSKTRNFPALITQNQSKNDLQIRMEFNYPNELSLTTILKVQRKQFTAQVVDYKAINPIISFSINKDKVPIMAIIDTSLVAYSAYNYKIKLGDIFGNIDSTTYYFEANNVPENYVPEPQNVKIEAAKDRRAFTISWEIARKELVQNIKLFRSRDFDKNYQVVANLNGNDKTTTNLIEMANELYHYYFEVTDIFGNKRKSIKYKGIYDVSYKPSPPIEVEAKPLTKGVELTWQASDPKTRGFYVFRKQGNKGEFMQISPLILIQKNAGKYVDSTKLNVDFTHFYAIKAESDTYDKSNFSDTVSYKPTNNIKEAVLKPPFNLNAVFRDNKIRVSWENLNAEIPQVLGYQVFRKKEGERDYKLLTESPLPFMRNFYVDSTFLTEGKYFFAIKSTDLQNNFSSQSQPISIDLAGKFVMFPANVGAEILPNGIKLKWTAIATERVRQIKIYRAEDNQDFKLLTSTEGTKKDFLDLTATKGKSYTYQISSIDLSNNESRRSEPFVVTY